MSTKQPLKSLSPGQTASLFDWLAEQVNIRKEYGRIVWDCDGTLTHTLRWLASHQEEVPKPKLVLAELKKLGGYCDCEVLLNVSLGPNPEML